MKSYFAYIRVSTQKQGEKGVSLAEQKDAIATYARNNSLDVCEWFEERETAAKRGRPVFSKMLTRLRKGEARGVIIHKIDRSARNLKDWADLGDLIDAGLDVHFAYESLDLTSRGGRLSADIQAIIAADYIRNLRGEVRKGLYGRLKQGLYPFGAPLGYLNQGGGQVKVPDPNKAHLVRRAFELYATGTFTLHSLRDELGRLGLTNKAGGRLTVPGLSKLLNNPFYCGIMRLRGTGETFNGKHEPLMSVALFEQVQAVLTGKIHTRAIRHDHLFRRLLTCGHCRYTLIGERQKGRVYYRCHTRECPTTTVREDAAEKEFDDSLSRVQLRDEEIAELQDALARYDETAEVDRDRLLEGAKLNFDRIKQRFDRLTDALLDGLIDKDIFDERRTKLVLEKRAAEENLEALTSGTCSVPQQMAEFLERLKTLHSSYILATPYEKRRLLRELTSNRFLSGKQLRITLREPYRTLANRPVFLGCAHQRKIPRTAYSAYTSPLIMHLLWPYFDSRAENAKDVRI